MIDRLSTFGPAAERLREALPAGLHAVVFDATSAPQAYLESVARRQRGERFYAFPLLDDLRIGAYTPIAAAISGVPDPDQRYLFGEHLAYGTLTVSGGPSSELFRNDPRPWAFIAETIALADGLLVRSFYEYTAFFGSLVPTQRMRRIGVAPSIPDVVVQPSHAPSVVVWPGRRPIAESAIALVGLEEFRGDVTYIGEEPLPHVRGRFVARDDAAVGTILGGAGCVVCTDPSDPADAVALARCGVAVVAPMTSGAIEFVPNVSTWDAGNSAALYAAVAIALGRAPDIGEPHAVPSAPPGPAFSVTSNELPLVSILTATYNRRAFLPKMLSAVAAQTYPNIESVVVNDCGEPVDDIVAAFPFARVINLEQNRGTLGALERALAEARGAYIGLLPDDDWIYPDHVEVLMAAILRSGAAVAHTHSLIRFTELGPDGLERLRGYSASAYDKTINPTPALYGTPVAGHQCLQRTDTFAPDDVGWYRPDSIVADQEYHMRLVQKHQLVYVPEFTCEFRDHAGNSGKLHDWATALEDLYARLHPIAGRPIIAEMRRAAVERARSVPLGENVNLPTLIVRSPTEVMLVEPTALG